MTRPDGSGLVVDVLPGSDLAAGDRAAIDGLFEATYDRADRSYLDVSFRQLRYVAIARDGDRVVGFAAGDGARLRLPRMSVERAIALAGICCIDADYRRMGLFQRLGVDSIVASGVVVAGEPLLFTGRMAHPITYRTMANRADNAVPRAGLVPSRWHRDVGRIVADLYGVEVDPSTFVVRGRGRPIGFPRIDYEATPEERELFAPVDRSRGDSLLAMSWMPAAPEGWGAGE